MKEICKAADRSSQANQDAETECANALPIPLCVLQPKTRSHSTDRALRDLGVGMQKGHSMLPLSAL